MREILTIQAGNFANYVGTHFWNSEEAYFTYGQDSSSPDVDHDVSFREGLARDGSATYCPRLVLFDWKDNMGSLPAISELYAGQDQDLALGCGDIQEVKQDPIQPGPYSDVLVREQSDDKKDPLALLWDAKSVRYWSDFSRVDFHPRSLHPISQPLAASDSLWDAGRALYAQSDQQFDVFDTKIRLFAEECDSMQGFQLGYDTSDFGHFMLSLTEMLRDEYAKKPLFGLSYLSAGNICVEDYQNNSETSKVMVEAEVIRTSASSLAATVVPIQAPNHWNLTALEPFIDLDVSVPYQSSAILSAHVETATMGLRSRNNATDLHSLCNHLNWRGDTFISALSGVLPIGDFSIENDGLPVAQDFTVRLDPTIKHVATPYAQRTSIRSGVPREIDAVQEKLRSSASAVGLYQPLFLMSAYRPYPLPSSYPRFFKGTSPPTGSVSMLSSLTTTPAVRPMIQAYADFVAGFVKHGDFSHPMWQSTSRDEMKELAEDLVKMADAYGEEDVPQDEDPTEDDRYELDI